MVPSLHARRPVIDDPAGRDGGLRPRASPGGRGAPSAAEIRSQGAIMSVKKELSGRRSVQVEAEAPGSTQSAVARRSAEAELRRLIDKFAPTYLRLVGAMRRSLRKRLPTAF